MNIVNKLTLRHLRLNRGRTAITVLGIVLSVAMVCCVAGFVMSMRDLLIREIKLRRGDYHAAFTDVAPETAEAIMREDIFVQSSAIIKEGGDAELPALLLRLDLRRDINIEDIGAIAEKYGVTSWEINNELLALEGVIYRSNELTTFVVIAAVAVTVIIISSVTVIANAFYISVSERSRQFALLKSAGATREQLRRSVFFEALVLSAAAIPIGLLLGYLIQAAVLNLTNGLLDGLDISASGEVEFRVIFSPLAAAFSAAVAVVTALLSAWSPARRAAAISPVETIRQSGDVSIRSNEKLRIPRITERVFGFEGVLAAKTLKRNKSKYRAAVVSLTVSVILFVSMSSLVRTINKAVDMEYGGYDFDVSVMVAGNLGTSDKADTALRSIPGADMRMSRFTHVYTTVPDGFVTDRAEAAETFENGYGLIIRSIPDVDFERYLTPSGDGVRGVLFNSAVYTRDGRRVETEPFNCEIGTELPINMSGGADGLPDEIGKVTIGKVVTEIPGDFPMALFDSNLINVYIPESAYRNLFGEYRAETVYAVKTAEPDAFAESAAALLGPMTPGDEGYYHINNFAATTRLYRNITLIIMLFGYGFIAMLSLIAITSVTTTISTGMALRRKEFAMLYSVGMTPGGMNKMLNLESLMYGFKSMAFGLPIGAALSYLIHCGIVETFVFAYELPAAAMAVSAAAVMLLTFAAMRYGKRKLNKISIIETIRGETA